MKKTFNIISYALNIILLIVIVSQSQKVSNKTDDKLARMKRCIVENERASLPIQIQSMKNVSNIFIDSLVLINNLEPYYGYLVTQWDMNTLQVMTGEDWYNYGCREKHVRKTKTVYVKVSEIMSRRHRIYWDADWTEAYRDCCSKYNLY